MASTSASSDMCSSSSTPTSAFDTLSSSLLYGLPPLSSPLNPNAAPVFFPSAVSPASVGPALSVAPPLLPYASHQSSSVYYPNPTPPPLSVSGLDGSWRPVASPALYYPSQPMAGQRALTAEWESTSFEYSSGIGHGGGMSALRGVGGGLPSLPYSGYPAFERCSVGRQSSNSGSSRQMSAGRQRWDSGSRWRAPSRGAGRQRSHHTHPQPQQLQSNQHTQLAIAGSAHTSSMPHTSDQALSTHDVANASPALSGVGRMFDPPSTKLVDRGLPRPEAIETALDDRGDRKHRWHGNQQYGSLAYPSNLHNQPPPQASQPTPLWQQQQQQAVPAHYPNISLPPTDATTHPTTTDNKVLSGPTAFRVAANTPSAAASPIA